LFCGGLALDKPDEKGATSLLTKALKEFNKPIKLFKRCCLCKQTYQSAMRLVGFFSNRGQAKERHWSILSQIFSSSIQGDLRASKNAHKSELYPCQYIITGLE